MQKHNQDPLKIKEFFNCCKDSTNVLIIDKENKIYKETVEYIKSSSGSKLAKEEEYDNIVHKQIYYYESGKYTLWHISNIDTLNHINLTQFQKIFVIDNILKSDNNILKSDNITADFINSDDDAPNKIMENVHDITMM